jgi:hypothetical protein
MQAAAQVVGEFALVDGIEEVAKQGAEQESEGGHDDGGHLITPHRPSARFCSAVQANRATNRPRQRARFTSLLPVMQTGCYPPLSRKKNNRGTADSSHRA